jgi:hypothetical protein
MFVLICASAGRMAVQQYMMGSTSIAPQLRNWDKEFTALLPISQKRQTYTYEGQKYLCDVTINKDHTGESAITLKDGSTMRIPFTMTIVGNAVNYHYKYQGSEWDYNTTMEHLMEVSKNHPHDLNYN